MGLRGTRKKEISVSDEFSYYAYHSGIDYFTSDAKLPAREDLFCRACNTKMVGEKSNGATSFAEAMAKRKHVHWAYHCKNSMKKAHGHLIELLEEREHLKSGRLKKIVDAELSEKRRAFLKSLKSVEGKKKA